MEKDPEKLLEMAMRVIEDHRLMGHCPPDLLVWWANTKHKERKKIAQEIGRRE